MHGTIPPLPTMPSWLNHRNNFTFTLCPLERRLGGPRLMGEMRNTCNILVAKPMGREHSEGLGTDGKIILQWILGK
jgi:hypothetical protein